MDKVTWLRVALLVFGVLALVASLTIEIINAREQRRQAEATLKRAIDTNEAAVLASKSASEASRIASVAAESAREASARTKEAVDVLGTLVARVENVQEEVQRTAEQIELVSLELEFKLPMTNPLLADYRARLDNALIEFGSLEKTMEERDKLKSSMSYSGASIAIKGMMRGNVWLNSSSEFFPGGAQGDNAISRSLIIREIELAFLKTPIDPKTYELSRLTVVSTGKLTRKLKPDLGIAQLFNSQQPSIIWSKVPPVDEGYRLQMLRWTPPKPTWISNTEKVRFLRDLAGSQLLINVGGYGKQTAPVRGEFEVSAIRLLINNSRVAVDPSTLVKHLNADGQPLWEFRFPVDPEKMFVPD